MATTPVSPKVTAGANWAGYATLLLTLLSTVTPDMLTFLGKLAPLAYGVVIGGTYALGAYLKADPLRDAGAEKQDAAGGDTPSAPQADPAPATSFAATQAKLDALAAPLPEPEYVPLDKPTEAPAQTIA